MIAWFVFVVAMLVFLGVGLAATFWTERVRSYWIRQSERHPGEFHWELVGRRVRKPSYSFELRLIGILCLTGGVFFIWRVIGAQ